jgi:hypothetical protein
MSGPGWVDELKQRYLAEAGNVFLLTGPVSERAWAIDGETLDAAHTLVRVFRKTREIVAILRPAPPPSRLEFADITDRGRFENLVKAYDLVQGRALPLVETDPLQALGRIWRALSTTGTDQAYIVTDTERLLPAHRRRIDEVPGAPALADWPASPVLRRSNNLVVFLAPSRDAVRAELADAAVWIDLNEARTPPPPSRDETPPPTDGPTDGPPDLPPPPPDAPAGDLREDLAAALRSALGRHPAENRASLVPVMEAVARVIAARRPGFEVPTFGIDPEGAAAVSGTSAEAFLALWRSDIALDAAASMLVRSWNGNGGAVDETGLSALVRRVERLLSR